MYYSFAISSAVKPVACEISKIIYSLPYYFSSNPQYVKDRFYQFLYIHLTRFSHRCLFTLPFNTLPVGVKHRSVVW